MSLRLVVNKEFRDVRRSRMLWSILGLGVGFMVLLMMIVHLAASESPTGTEFIEFFAGIGGQLIFPILALIVGYMALVGERQSGSIRILHGLPHSRREILIGKFIGRAGVIAAAVIGSFVAVTALSVLLLDSVAVVNLVLVAGATTLFAVTFVGIAVGISASTESRGRAMAGAIGAYFLFAVIWEPLVAGIHYLIEGSLVGYQAPAWYFLLRRLSPAFAFTDLVSAILDTHVPALFSWPVEQIPAEEFEQEGTLLLSNRVAGELPFYLEGWFAAVVLCAWIALALGVGNRLFRSADLA